MNFTNFVILANIFNNTLYVTKPRDALECYVAIDYDNDANSAKQWFHMKADDTSEPPICKSLLTQRWNNDAVRKHRIKFLAPDRSHYAVFDVRIPLVCDGPEEIIQFTHVYNSVVIIAILATTELISLLYIIYAVTKLRLYNNQNKA